MNNRRRIFDKGWSSSTGWSQIIQLGNTLVKSHTVRWACPNTSYQALNFGYWFVSKFLNAGPTNSNDLNLCKIFHFKLQVLLSRLYFSGIDFETNHPKNPMTEGLMVSFKFYQLKNAVFVKKLWNKLLKWKLSCREMSHSNQKRNPNIRDHFLESPLWIFCSISEKYPFFLSLK